MTASAPFALCPIRVSFGTFIALWGRNRILAPAGTERISAAFCGIDGLEVMAAQGLGAARILVGLAIMAGAPRTASQGLGVLIHGASTLATLPHLVLPLAEGSNLLFWTGVPVLCAAIGLFLARRGDVMLSLDARLSRARGASCGTRTPTGPPNLRDAQTRPYMAGTQSIKPLSIVRTGSSGPHSWPETG